jgi:uncharacterized protein (TIGR03437 family)
MNIYQGFHVALWPSLLCASALLAQEAPLSCVNAASFQGTTSAPESIVSAYGQGLAPRLEAAASAELPVTLAGVSVRVRDSGGGERTAPLFFVSPGQINFVLPAGTATGGATVTVLRDGQAVARGTVTVAGVAPGLFSANANGKGVAAAIAQRFGADGRTTSSPIFDCVGGTCAATALDLGAESDQTILLLFGTGIRHQTQVTAQIGSESVEVLGAVAQGQYQGLDQVNVRVPRKLAGRGEVEIVLTINGQTTNAVTVRIGGGGAPAGSSLFPLATGLEWEYRVVFPQAASLPYLPEIENPAGLLCASGICGTGRWDAGIISFKMTVGEKLEENNYKITLSDPGGKYYFWNAGVSELRTRTVQGREQHEIVTTVNNFFKLARLLARPTETELAARETVTVPAGEFKDTVKTIVQLRGDGSYVRGTYSSEVYLAPGAGIVKVVQKDPSGSVLCTQELTQKK